ncbi:hypothetical protein Lalb_Chr09g0323131 [Lupinus albus]|uniref:Uncharacterized protein n=1 Tax=Lupinus albus TaxID=3870 RepID=A0A6A4PZ98_LUPAL|nr:hypothetical protein Lalb_Chr09g0323131 [Lupinus albus]
MNPRISFSNDFVESKQAMRQERSSSSSETAPHVSSDFEFSSVTNYSMMSSADELLFKGRLLPYKDNNNHMHRATTTLREELLVNDDESKGFSLKPQKGSSSTRWKGFLGLRKSHIGSKNKGNRSEGSSDSDVQARKSPLVNEGSPLSQVTNHSFFLQHEMLNEGESSCGDLEIGL